MAYIVFILILFIILLLTYKLNKLTDVNGIKIIQQQIKDNWLSICPIKFISIFNTVEEEINFDNSI